MRIIAGERRGHGILGPKGKSTRPTSDLVREALYNILREVVVGRVVIDLFAGTGAIGLEGLSRGTAHAVFVEKNRENVSLILHNLEKLRYEDRARVQLADAYRWVRGFEPAPDASYVVLLDPPYRDFEVLAKKLRGLLVDLAERMPAGTVIVVESGLEIEPVLPDLESWEIRRYGGTQVGIRTLGEAGDDAARDEAEAEAEEEAETRSDADA